MVKITYENCLDSFRSACLSLPSANGIGGVRERTIGTAKEAKWDLIYKGRRFQVYFLFYSDTQNFDISIGCGEHTYDFIALNERHFHWQVYIPKVRRRNPYKAAVAEKADSFEEAIERLFEVIDNPKLEENYG